MYETDEIDIRSKDNVRENGEVFTPFAIVDKMVALIPDKAWSDPEYCFLEPTCGNGQFLVKIFERRINAGISIEVALNTMIGMDITYQNIAECHFRLYERVCCQFIVEGIVPQSKEWFSHVIKAIAVINNNIFQVKDSIAYIETGKLKAKKFFFADPTGSKQVITANKRQKKIDFIKQQIINCKKNGKYGVLAPFFKKEINI